MSSGNDHRTAWSLLPILVILLMMLLAPLLAGGLSTDVQAGAPDRRNPSSTPKPEINSQAAAGTGTGVSEK